MHSLQTDYSLLSGHLDLPDPLYKECLIDCENTNNFNDNDENSIMKKIVKICGKYFLNIFNIIKIIFCIIIFSLFLKNIFPIQITSIGKNSFLTGIPILRYYYFFSPTVLHLCVITMLSVVYYKNKNINEKFLVTEYIQNLFLFNIPSFICKILCFYFLYKIVFVEINTYYKIKVSGHVLATIISSALLINSWNLLDNFTKKIKEKINFSIFEFFIIFILFHNLYCLIWTAWVFHTFTECLTSWFLSWICVLTIECLKVDQIFLNLILAEY